MKTELIETLEDRAAAYGLLARLFIREADSDLLDVLEDTPLGDETDTSAVSRGARLMRSYLDQDHTDAESELAVDFARLFIVRTAHAHGVPYPFESVYTTDDRTTMGDARDRVLALYREENLGTSGSWNVGEDHIALELEFEQLLCRRSADAVRANDEQEARRLLVKQQSFLTDHLLTWSTPFAEAVEATANTDFYRGAALLLIGHLEEDRRLLCDLLG